VAQAAGPDGGPVRLTALVSGRVQGVGMRWWTRTRAQQLGLVGWAANRDDGRVEVVAEGPEAACRALVEALRSRAGPGWVTAVTERWEAPQGGLEGFVAR
jgi:acylphosphatase